jgi:transcriptional regulator with XRE-family HTH domain
MKLEERLAKNIRRRRGTMTQNEFSKKLSISQSTLDRIEKGEQNVTLKTLDLLMKKLKCGLIELFDE